MSSFADLSSWAWLIQLFLIVVALLVANLVRCNVPLFRRSLLPSALLAGLLILCLKPIGAFSSLVDRHVMEIITYHALGLGFVAMALKNKKIKSATSTIKVVETGAVTASTYIIQGLCGLLLTVPMFLWWNNSDFCSPWATVRAPDRLSISAPPSAAGLLTRASPSMAPISA